MSRFHLDRLRAWLCLPCALVAACGAEAPVPPARLEPLPDTPAYAVVTSDYVSTALALLDPAGDVVTEAWIDSGTVAPGLAMALSGDVSLPTAPVTPGVLTLIDRGTGTLLRISMPDGAVLSQWAVTTPTVAGEAGYRANPQDVVADGSDLVVSRFAPNLAPDAAALNRGNDLVRLSADGTLSGRVALDAMNLSIMGVTVYARPARMAAAGPRLLVGLARLSARFTTAGPGAIAVVDLATGAALELSMPGLVNCSEVVPVAGDPARAVVGCAGPAFGSPTARRASAGLALVVVAPDGAASVERVWRASDHAGVPVASGGLVSLGGSRVLVVASGDVVSGVNDQLLDVNLETGAATSIFEAWGAFILGPGVYNARDDLALIPDATAGAVRGHIDGAGDFVVADRVAVSRLRALPSREIRAL